MESPLVSILTLALLTLVADHDCAPVITASKNPLPVGSNVTLSLSNYTGITVATWSHGRDNIVVLYPGGFFPLPDWKDRIVFNTTTLALSIMSLQVKDSGQYLLQTSFSASLNLSVQEPISGVTLRANATNLVEFNDTAFFTCSVASGSSLSYHWLDGTSELNATDRVQLGDGGSTLTIVNVTRYDQGPFRCDVSNAISDGFSQAIPLNISYGPSYPKIMITPRMDAFKTGSTITLSCAAESNPPAKIQWLFDEQYLDQYSSELHLKNVKENQTGIYKCLVHNAVTNRFAGVTTKIRIVEPISEVEVKRIGRLPILNESFILSCEVTGPVDYIRWWKNGQAIPNNRSALNMENMTLTFNPVQHSDNGDYYCEAFNAISNMRSAPYEVVVNYGPEMPVITGPSVSLTEERVTFNCSATSQPPSHYMWFFNGSLVANTSQYETQPLTLDMSGKYICVAHNEITGRNSSAYKMLTVFAPLTKAEVKMVGAQPIVNHTFTLVCETTGSVDSIYWLRNGRPLYADSRRNLSLDNTRLTFDPVLLSDNGLYQCHVSNPLSSLLSQNYSLLVIYGPETPVITGPSVSLTEERVTFNCSAASQPPSHYMWFFNGSLVANTSQYETQPLTLDMSGKYICMARNEITGRNSSAYKMLTVFAPVTKAEVKMVGAQPIVNHTFTLVCETTGSVDSIYWLRNGRPLYADSRRNLSLDNTSLTFDPVLLSDNGLYQCHVSNPVSSLLSQDYSLLVIYGPEKPTITGPELAMAGRSVTFNCSASSHPPSNYRWFFNGTLVANTSEYETGPLMTNMSGKYTCMAHNYVSGKNSTAYTTLIVIEAIVDVQIEEPLESAIEGHWYNLSCEVTGSVDHIYWLKDGQPLDFNNSTTLSMDNKTIIFNPVELSDIGKYQCEAFNAVSNMTSPPYRLTMYYGPGVPHIYGPSIAEVGETVTFNCSAASLPPSQFTWFFSGFLVANTSHYQTEPLTLNMSGEYTCLAFNNVTQRNSTSSTMLTVIDGIQSVTVKPDTTPIDHKNLSLTCEISGEYESVYWLKDNIQLDLNSSAVDAHISRYTMNNSLHFNPVRLSDDGSYQCVATNIIGPHRSPKYKLLVNYGPLSVNIKGPASAAISSTSTVTFECSADSRPTSKFKWFFNNKPLTTSTDSAITIWVTPVHAGNYTCLAENPVTEISMSKTKKFTVTGRASALPLQSRGGLMLMAVFALFVPVVNNWLFH